MGDICVKFNQPALHWFEEKLECFFGGFKILEDNAAGRVNQTSPLNSK